MTEKKGLFFFKISVYCAIIGSGLFAGGVKGQVNPEVFTTSNKATLQWMYYDNIRNPLYDHIASDAFELLEARKRAIDEVQSPERWRAKQADIRKKLREVMQVFPEKTPLNARITRTIKKEGFTLEHIVFESLPGFYVSSSLYLPSARKSREKLPTVIYCSGHNTKSYDYENYQHEILNLVKKGFAVFAFDPIGQGERLEYVDPVTSAPGLKGGSVARHSYPGAQAFITGNAMSRYMIWDGIRAVDYLMTRKEIDGARLAITGRSGGGTQSAFISAVDDRILVSAPECWVTNRKRLLQSIGPQDGDQHLLFEIEEGIDHPDFLIARAPKPTMIVTTTNDFFSIQGARETVREVSEIYRAFGKAENLQMVEDIGIHESTKKNREAKYAFFQEHLNHPGSSEDVPVEILSAEEMQVTPTGQVVTSYGSETTFSLNRVEAEKLNHKLEQSRVNLNHHLPDVLRAAKEISGFRAPTGVSEPLFTGSFIEHTIVTEKYFIEGEGDYVVPYLLHRSPLPGRRAVIYLHPDGKVVDSVAANEIRWFVQNGFTVLVPDMLGTGETGPDNYRGDSSIGNVRYNIWFGSMLTKRSIAAIRAGDVVRLTKTLEAAHGFGEVCAVARGNMTAVLQHAAAFSNDLKRIALVDPLSSYHSLVTTKIYSPQLLFNAVAGSLTAYDLPDLTASLAPRKLLIVNAVDGAGQRHDQAAANDEFAVVEERYKSTGVSDHLVIRQTDDASLVTLFADWIK